MDMSSLFPADSGLGSVLSGRPSAHVSFKAGILNRDTTTNLVTADERKGIFQIITSPEDQLMHLQWRPRNQPTADQDLILFSGETEMKKVTSCAATARVYVLKWKGADKRMFFWMQEKDPSADEAHIAQVNSILENGVDNQQAVRSTDSPEPNEEASSSSNPDVVMAPQPSTPQAAESPAPTAPAPLARGTPITLEQMRAALPSGRGSTGAGNAAAGGSVADPENALRMALAQAQREQVLTTPSVTDLLNLEALRTVLQDPQVQAHLPALLQHLPEQDQSVDRISELLRSPPLRSQAAALSHALQSGQASELIRSFELPNAPTTEMYGLRAFMEALRELEKQSKESRK